ncbi:MAG: ATP-binding protein [Acidobacteriota bacterium]|nr:ATP-binding protein [Acidobacteriota bacterium]
MNRVDNPYSPGAGAPPPELVGRDALREEVAISIARLRVGRSAKNTLMVGLRGVGKTVLLERMRVDAEREGVLTVRAETPENRSLPALLAPQLRSALLNLSRIDAARELATRGLSALAGFVKRLKVKYSDLELSYDVEPTLGEADSGDLEVDLSALMERVGEAARMAETAVIIFIDEVQYLPKDQFGALIAALHRCAQRSLPVGVVGAGLPQLRALAGHAKSYAERMFDFPPIGPLPNEEAKLAISKPADAVGISFTEAALTEVLHKTQGYPYFLQEWGKHSWDVAKQSPITEVDVKSASSAVVAALDHSFFLVRFDRLTPAERKYLRAMAELGPGPHRSGDIATVLGKKVSALGPLRERIIGKGMVWSPNHGDTAFTVPLFDGFMKRIMPGDGWKTE